MPAKSELQKTELTIIKSGLLRATADDWKTPESVIQRIQGKALTLLLDTVAPGNSSASDSQKRALLLFDCLLRIIAEPVIASPLAFATPRFATLQLLFYGALGSEKFIEAADTSRSQLAYYFFRIIKKLSESTSVAIPEYHQRYAHPIPATYVERFNSTPLDVDEVRSLRPYLLTSKSGTEYNVLIGDLVPVLGETFTAEFHQGLCSIARSKAKDTALRDFGTTFARFVLSQHEEGKSISVDLLRQPSFVQDMMVDFMEHHFTKMMRREDGPQEGTLSSLQKLWSRYIIYWDKLSKKGIVAAPAMVYPSGNPRLLAGMTVAHRKVKIDENGNAKILTHKLLTPVPLTLSDEEATKVVFEQIKHDFEIAQSWVRNHIESFFKDFETGISIANQVDSLPPDHVLKEMFANKNRRNEALPFAIKYFKEACGGYVDTSKEPTLAYPKLAAREGLPKSTLARYLGIPRRTDAMAMMALLVSYHGSFTESALATAKLFDKGGKRINVVHTDAGLTLSVLKERDATDGWIDVVLNEEAANVVTRWIKVTTPLRNYMKEHNVEGWQNLIIYTGNPLGAPAFFERTSNINSTFRSFALSHRSVLKHLADYVTIPRIRSTLGVLVFLEKMDLTQMAKELGNTSETSLRHYLPDALWEYFTTRWIRIFQNLLIVEATKDTPYMHRALRFNSAEEVDEFLRKHALKPIVPEGEEVQDAKARDGLHPDKHATELMVAASPGIFTTLLSISEAVNLTAQKGLPVNPKARYWAEFTVRIKGYIEGGQFHDRSIKQMLAKAVLNTDPLPFMEVACA